MHPVAKRCLTWAIVLVVVGVLAIVYGPNVVWWFDELLGANAEVGSSIFYVVMQIIRSFALPLAAGLVTATIIVQTLAPRPVVASAQEDEDHDRAA
ncbi:hypothetical protein [Demequina sp. NBRC 110056]|uniref:hypothetical protein n=1 Tax=Demequina sp. NBRC 110056 TaxID=1570345 RepID=UPI0009FD543A|nr:hypothetical protein [Demequina sp. NBRC 110056]